MDRLPLLLLRPGGSARSGPSCQFGGVMPVRGERGGSCQLGILNITKQPTTDSIPSIRNESHNRARIEIRSDR